VRARRGPAGDLRVDDGVGFIETVAPEELSRDFRIERGLGRDPERRQPLLHPREVLFQMERASAEEADDFVDRVAE
jgi:hypothetical protein